MEIKITLDESKISFLCGGLIALNKAPGRSLEESATIISLYNELQTEIAKKEKIAKESK